MSDLRDLLQEIYDRRGELTPKIVVDEARDPASPLHSRFEWNDGIAAEKYREQQAGGVIRSVKITYTTSPTGEEKKVNAYVSLSDASSEGMTAYKPVEVALADPADRAELLRQCKRDWMAFQRKYSHLEEFADIISSSGYATAV